MVNTFPAIGGHDKNPVYPPVKNIKDNFPVTSIRSAVQDNPLKKKLVKSQRNRILKSPLCFHDKKKMRNHSRDFSV